MIKIIGWIMGLAVFAIWMSLVGNPHVAETAIGLVLACGAGFWSYYKLKRFVRSLEY